MALPKLTTAKYPISIPSTGKKTFFRPFLVKEQKILLMASESRDEKQIAKAICDIVEQCVDGVDDPAAMPVFDIEYLFLNIRAKSAGEVVNLGAKCPKCSRSHSMEVKLDEIQVDFKGNIPSKIMLTDTTGIVLRYPCLGDATVKLDDLDAESVVAFVANLVECVFDGDNIHAKKDFTHREMVDFLDSMTTQQFEKVMEFFKNMPRLRKEMLCRCVPACGHEFRIDFTGLADFFT